MSRTPCDWLFLLPTEGAVFQKRQRMKIQKTNSVTLALNAAFRRTTDFCLQIESGILHHRVNVTSFTRKFNCQKCATAKYSWGEFSSDDTELAICKMRRNSQSQWALLIDRTCPSPWKSHLANSSLWIAIAHLRNSDVLKQLSVFSPHSHEV